MYSENDLKKYFPDREERMAFSKALDCARRASVYYEASFTDFLDMEKITEFMEKLAYIDTAEAYAFGGMDECERRIIGFFPDYMEFKKEDFPITPVIIKHDRKFSRSLSHRDYLGSLTGLGIDRRKMGDIVVFDDFAIAFVHRDIADYITANLEYVGRTRVSCDVYKGNMDIISPKDGIERYITSASLRLDAVLSASFNVSRGKAADLIKSEIVKVNWKTISSNSFNLSENDMISAKGFGRVRISEIKGTTKKNRIGIIIEKFA